MDIEEAPKKRVLLKNQFRPFSWPVIPISFIIMTASKRKRERKKVEKMETLGQTKAEIKA